MKKKTNERKTVVLDEEYIDIEIFNGSLHEVIERLKKLEETKKNQWPNCFIDIDPNTSLDGIEPLIVVSRWETDEELARRLKKNEAAREKMREKRKKVKDAANIETNQE